MLFFFFSTYFLSLFLPSIELIYGNNLFVDRTFYVYPFPLLRVCFSHVCGFPYADILIWYVGKYKITWNHGRIFFFSSKSTWNGLSKKYCLLFRKKCGLNNDITWIFFYLQQRPMNHYYQHKHRRAIWHRKWEHALNKTKKQNHWTVEFSFEKLVFLPFFS